MLEISQTLGSAIKLTRILRSRAKERIPLEERLVSAGAGEDEQRIDRALRPVNFDNFIGQEKIKSNLKVFIQAARERGESLDHVLLYGPPGLGKTTLAHIIARQMEVNIRVTSGPAIERPGDLAAIVTNLGQGDVLFIDEIHRLHRSVEEILYPAMEDFALDFIIGKGPSARSLRLDLAPFTLIGATTRAGLLSSPLRDRFGVVNRLEFYLKEDLTKIILNSAEFLNISISETGALKIAESSRGTPRIANRLLKRVRDFAQVQGNGVIDDKIAHCALELLEVDHLGLDQIDRKLLTVMIEKFSGGPVGLDTLAAAISEESETIEDVYEPYLLQIGFISRTPRGRMVTPMVYQHLKIKTKHYVQKSLLD